MTEFDPVALVTSGEAFADLSFWRKIELTGSEGGRWLQDLISADIEDLLPGHAHRSLLLSPTGRVRAQFTVARTVAGWLLLQDPTQPRPIDQLLAPFILSSDVVLKDRTDDLALFAFPGRLYRHGPPRGSSIPSCLGPRGLDLIVPVGDREKLIPPLEQLFARVGDQTVEEWRVHEGIPRFGVDALEDDLPQEAGLDDAVAFDKGCYLGQEALAKVRNLGHPRRLVLSLAAPRPVQRGDAVLADGRDAGVITSAVTEGEGSTVLARVRWDARDLPLRTSSGTPLAKAARPAQPQPSSPV